MPYECFPDFINGRYFPTDQSYHEFLEDVKYGLLDDEPESSQTPQPPPAGKLLVTAAEAAFVCGCGERTWHRMNSEQKCPAPVKLNSSVRWNRNELREWTSAGCPSRDHWERTRSRDCR